MDRSGGFSPKELIPVCPASSVVEGKYGEPMFQKPPWHRAFSLPG
ncbi:arylesterase [Pseudomonas syringae pv. tomato T1]|nr:arylesterase [Pseudomonas syringae pv. tomato T1]